MPSALQADLQGEETANCSYATATNRTCCTDCLGLGPDKYNQLYAAFSWTNALLVLPTSILVDKIGVRISGILFTSSTVVGTSLLATATLPHFRGTSAMFPMMIAGRVLLGAGSGPTRVIQMRVLAIWFPDKLAMTFGLVITFLRLGSVLNFLVTSNMANLHGLTWALWGGAFMCGTAFVSSVFMALFDWYGSKRIEHSQRTKTASSIACKDIKVFTVPYWVVAVMLASFYGFLNPFIANFTKYAQDKYGYSKMTASYIDGALYDVSVFLCPVLGLFLDKYGWRVLVATFGPVLCLPMVLMIMFTDIPPVIATVVLGIGYTFTVVSLRPCVALLVPIRVVGTANGIVALMLQGVVGGTNFAIGKILGNVEERDPSVRDEKWMWSLTLICCFLAICFLLGVVINILDKRLAIGLNKTKFERKEEVTESVNTEESEKEPLLGPSSPKIQ